MLFNILVALFVVIVLLVLAVALVCAYMLLPLSDLVNSFFRRVGLAGPSPESRSVGMRGLGTVVSAFSLGEGEEQGVGKVLVKGEIWNALCQASLAPTLAEGDAVEIIYNEDLTVTVLGKA